MKINWFYFSKFIFFFGLFFTFCLRLNIPRNTLTLLILSSTKKKQFRYLSNAQPLIYNFFLSALVMPFALIMRKKMCECKPFILLFLLSFCFCCIVCIINRGKVMSEWSLKWFIIGWSEEPQQFKHVHSTYTTSVGILLCCVIIHRTVYVDGCSR